MHCHLYLLIFLPTLTIRIIETSLRMMNPPIQTTFYIRAVFIMLSSRHMRSKFQHKHSANPTIDKDTFDSVNDIFGLKRKITCCTTKNDKTAFGQHLIHHDVCNT